MSITFRVANYQLTCDKTQEQLKIKLSPVDFTKGNVNLYMYQAKYKNSSMPEQLKFIFDSNIENWFKYIQIQREKCIRLDLNLLRQNQISNPQMFVDQCQIPINFTFLICEELTSPKIKLYGSKQYYARQKFLEKENQSLRQAYLQSQKDYQLLINTYNEKIREYQEEKLKLLEKISDLQAQISRNSSQQPPRKKIHLSEVQNHVYDEDSNQKQSQSPQNYTYIPVNHQDRLRNNQKSPIIHIEQQKHISREMNQFQVNDNFDSQDLRLDENQSFKNQSDLLNQALNCDPPMNNIAENSRQTGNNQIINKPDTISFSLQNKEKKGDTRFYAQFSNSNTQNKEKFYQTQSPINIQSERSMNNSKKINESLENHNSSTSYNGIKTIPVNQVSSTIESKTGNRSQDENLDKIRRFAAEKCHLEVGFDEKGNKKYGYSCIMCDKVFKQDEFLAKHYLSKHPEIVNATVDLLDLYLLRFKKRRQQRIIMAELNISKSTKLETGPAKITK